MSKTTWCIVLPISMLIVHSTTENKIVYESLVEKTMTMIRTCTMLEPGDTLLLVGEYEEFLRRPILGNLPVALIAESESSAFGLYALSRYSFTVFKRFSFAHLLWKLNQFVVIASSEPLLKLLLQRVKDSTWSNFNGFHVLIDGKTEDRGCANAYGYLWTAWRYDLLYTVFLCIDPEEGLVLYTYNPYSSEAPNTWSYAGHFEGRRRHPWTLLKRKYEDGPKVCKDLKFDKTTRLNGYEVRLNAISFTPHLRIDHDAQGLEKFSGANSEIVKLIFAKLNATLDVIVYNGTAYDLGGIGSHGNLVGMLADVGTGIVDMGMNVRSLHAMWKVEYTYPYDEDSLCVVTQQSGEISELVKIVSVMSPMIILGNVAIFFIALLMLAKHEGFLLATLNVVRLITSVSMRRLPRYTAFRIFLTTVFLLFMIVNALLQCRWASLLTVPVSLPNIRNLEDLKSSDYKIYGSMFYTQEINDPEVKSRFLGVSYNECKQRVLQSKSTACLGDCVHLYASIKDENLHRSKRIQKSVQAYATRENWPLFDRVTKVLRRTVEAGLVTMWRNLNTRSLFLIWKGKQMKNEKRFKTLEIRHLTFSFYLLGIGCSCAAVAFVVELILGRSRAGRKNSK